MDARLSSLEVSFADLQSLIAEVVKSSVHSDLESDLPAHLDRRLPVYFEQFRREFSFQGVGDTSMTPPVPPPPLPPDLDLPPPPRHLTWIYKAEQFFTFYNIPENQRVLTASFHLEGEALQWFQWMDCLTSTPDWSAFTKVFCREFGPNEFEDSAEALFKLRQTGTLRDYVVEFRRLANRTTGIGPILLKSCFFGGLKRELKFDVKLLKLATVHEAIAIDIAGQLDSKLTELRATAPRTSNPVKPQPLLDPPSAPAGPRAGHVPVKKLTPAEIQLKRDKGECWFCPNKWVPGHKCGLKQLLMLDVVDSDAHCEFTDVDDAPPELLAMSLSECAFYGTTAKQSIQTMKVDGVVLGQSVKILLDSGSTHNFIDSRLLKKWGRQAQNTQAFEVMIADGGTVRSSGCCRDTALCLGGYNCVVDLYSLPLGGCDVVLGVQWLSSVSPVLWDFQLLTMEFSANAHHYKLTHSPPTAPLVQEVSLQHLDKEFSNSHLGLFLYSMEGQFLHHFALSPQQSHELTELLGAFEDIFVLPSKLPPSRGHDHHIPLVPGAKPPNLRPYHYGLMQKTEIERTVQELLDSGFIRPSHNPFSFPVLLVKKKEGTWRMCIDYRELNALTVKDKYPIPLIDDLLGELFGAIYFSKLDLRSGYHQILMSPEDVEKTAFRTHEGHYEFLNQLFLKHSKCSFGQNCVEYLGHVVSPDGVQADPSKLQAIKDWPPPKTVKGLRGFLGLTGYYRKFIPGYGKICQPLYNLTKRDGFTWDATAQDAFDHLKSLMMSPHVLALPDFTQPFEIECDASGNGIGAVLQQGKRPIAYTSKALGPKNQALSAYERELIAIVHAVKKWQNYLQGRHFIIRTDHNSLKYFLSQQANTSFQQKWVSKLLGFDYEIQYKKGNDNVVADALSRIPETLQFDIGDPPISAIEMSCAAIGDSPISTRCIRKTLLQESNC
ncbi:hypothetical protein ACFX13_040481 [Malus domestica]